MKTHAQSQTALAVLNSTQFAFNGESVGFAALFSESGADGWFHLLPASEFKAIDGRPFDADSGHRVLDTENPELWTGHKTSKAESLPEGTTAKERGLIMYCTPVAWDLMFFPLNIGPRGNIKARRGKAVSHLKDLTQGKVSLGITQETESLDTAEIQNDAWMFIRANRQDFI